MHTLVPLVSTEMQVPNSMSQFSPEVVGGMKQDLYDQYHYTTIHYTTLHYTTLHYTTLHFTTPHYTKCECDLLEGSRDSKMMCET